MARELASLRVLGFTRGEAGEMLLGELLVEFLVGLPLGFLIGYGLAGAATAAFSSETLTIPLVIYPGTYLISAGVVTVAAAFSALAVRRMLDRFDLISVLKSYE